VRTPHVFSFTLLGGSLGALTLVALAATQGVAARAPLEQELSWQQQGRVCASATSSARRPVPALDAISSIGVAYFAGRSRGGDDAHLAAALTSELATQLLSARPKPTGGKPGDHGRILVVKLSEGGGFSDVDLSMTGSIFREEEGVRTQVKLTRTSDGSVVWSGTKVRPVLEIPILARLIAQEVAVRINAELTAPSPRRSSEKSVEMYELLLRGMYIPARYDPDELLRAIEYFDRAIALDSTSARARELRENARLRLVAWGGTGSELESRLLREGALRRIQLRSRDESERLVEEAEEEIRNGLAVHACQLLSTAIDRDARSAPAYALRSLVRARGGEVRAAFADAEVVTQLGRPLWGNSLRAVALRRSGDTTAARQQVRRLQAEVRRRTGPLPFWDARFLATALAELNDWAGVQSVLVRIDPRDPRIQWVRRDPSLQRPSDRRSPRRGR
jgi:TolB-like protein